MSMEDHHEDLVQRKREINRRITVEPAVLLCFLAYYPILPYTDQYLYYRFSQENNFSKPENVSECLLNISGPTHEAEKHVQAQATTMSMYLYGGYILPCLISSSMLGAYSDQIGRKFALLLPLIGLVVKSVVFGFVVWFSLPLYSLIIMAVLEGSTGGVPLFIVGSFAYISDITSKEKRMLRIVLIEVSIGLGNAFSNMGMGYIIAATGFFYPIVIMGCVFVLALLYTIFAVQESIIPNPEAKFLSIDHFRKIVDVYFVRKENDRRWKLLVALFLFGLISVSDLGTKTVIDLYLLAYPLCFTSVLIGLYIGLFELVRQLGSVVCAKLLVSKLKDHGLLILGTIGGIMFNMYFGFTSTRRMVFFAPVVALSSALGAPMLRSIMSKLVHPNELGAMFVGVTLVQLTSAMVGNLICAQIYKATLGINKSITFYVMAGLCLVSTVIAIILGSKLTRSGARETPINENDERAPLLQDSGEHHTPHHV